MAKNIVILTGAGISAESGIDTFRAADGLWENHRVEDVATPEGFARNPQLVHDFYNARRAKLSDPAIQPNAAHVALAKLQQTWPDAVTLITQNVDNLHERGGSPKVLHMHGELLSVMCPLCGGVFRWHGDTNTDTRCPECAARGSLRPDIVWFGEIPYFMDEIYRSLANCSLFAAIGTSGKVYPAAGFVAEAKRTGAQTVEINLAPSDSAPIFDAGYYGKASEEVPKWVADCLGLKSL